MAIYKSGDVNIPNNNTPLNDWNKMMGELFYTEKRSISNSTPDSSSGVVSDDHYLTISEHSESFSSPGRALKSKSHSDNKTRLNRLATTPSPSASNRISISHHPSPSSSLSPTSKILKKGPPLYQNLPHYGNTSRHADPDHGEKQEPNKSESRLKKQIKSIFHSQNKFSPSPPVDQCKTIKNKKITFSEKVKKIEPTRPSHFDELEDRLVSNIFQYLSSNELCKCAMVCKLWYELVWNPCLWLHVVIDNPALDVDRGIRCLTTALSFDESKTCIIIESINLTGCHKLTDRGLYVVAGRCPKLKELVLDGCQEVTNIAIFEIVSRCTDLELLSLSGCQYVTCISLTPEANLQAATYGKQIYLSHLDMTDCINVDDSSLQMIVTYCSRLSYLYLRRCVKITDVGVQYAATYCNKLQELSVSDCPNISDLGMRDISRLESNLRYLSIAKCRRISDAGLKCVARKCVRTRYINMRGCDRITEEGVAYLAAYCSRLRSLDLGNCNHAVSDRSLEALAGCEQLRRLSLKGCTHFTDAGLILLAQKCRQLQQLNLIDCKVSSRAFDAVHKFCRFCIVEHNNPGLCL